MRCWGHSEVSGAVGQGHTHTHTEKDRPLEGEGVAEVPAEANACLAFSEAVNSLLTHHILTLNMLKLKL